MKKNMKFSLAWVGVGIAVMVAATQAQRLGYIESDAVVRIFQGVVGLYVVWLGNRLPKSIAPSGALQVARIGGWSMALSGLAYLGLWAFAPMRVAAILGPIVVLIGIAISVGYGLWLRAKAKAA